MNAHKPFILSLGNIVSHWLMEMSCNLPAIDQILELLWNGEWHGLPEITDKTGGQEFRVLLITSFLSEYNFLEFNERETKIRLSSELLLFMRKIREIEHEDITGPRQLH